MKTSHIALAVFLGCILASSALAEGKASGGMTRVYQFDNTNTSGWAMMIESERNDYRQKMLNAKSYEECKDVLAEHHKLMAERAKARYMTLMEPQDNACDRMKARGYFK